MDRNRFSALAHRTHTFCTPLSDSTFERLLSQLELKREARVADFGCGNAHMLMRVCMKFRCGGVGFEQNPHFVKLAREAIEEHAPTARIEVVEGDAAKAEQGPFDFVMCSGARPFAATAAENLGGLMERVRPGGVILLGEGYWHTTPSPAFLEALGGANEGDMTSHAGNVAAGEALGLVPLWATTASLAEWDDYEFRYSRAIEDFVAENPGDPDAKDMIARIREWRKAYLTMGRDTLGYGFYLFRKAA
ncbi:MAG: class I SAM-dependent methyltransferase [Alphaproteobacteria bacterium]|nr:class I SAM-dependent methyltransferase [Alphaproteobacteria bacterium]